MKYIHFSTLFRWKFGIGCSIRASSCISSIAYSKYSEKFYFQKFLILELAEHSPIITQNNSNPSSWKNLDVQPYDCMTVQGATFNTRGQLYHRPWLCSVVQCSVLSALGSELDDPGSSPGRGKALCPWDVWGKKKKQAPLLGFAKSIYYQRCCLGFLKAHKINWKWFHIWMSLNLQSAAVKFGNES